MAGILNEYIEKRLGINDLLKELDSLVDRYNKMTGHYLSSHLILLREEGALMI